MANIDTIIVPDDLTIMAPGEQPTDPVRNITVRFNEDTLTYDVMSVNITGGFDPVRAKNVRGMSLRNLLREHIRHQLYQVNKSNMALMSLPGVRSFFKDNTGRKLSAKLLANPDVKTLDSVAAIYHLARLSHCFTNVSVAKSLGVYNFEGERLVRLAKLEGHIHI